MDIQFKGARWFKCDLHLHTPASRCFKDNGVTPEQWVDACINAGLHCVAVTDHNTGEWIDRIKDAARGKSFTVFPGVEITCDTSKIHILAIFDTDKTTEFVNDFLIECGITRDMFSRSDAHSAKTVTDISKIANDKGAIVIPAHIDEFNGLGYCAGKIQFEQFLALPFIHAVQFVHKEFIPQDLKVADNKGLQDTINQYYGFADSTIGMDNIKAAYDSVQTSLNHNIKLLTFSDNPDDTEPSKHGIAGIGKRYSWIKMANKPSLEGIRQAFIMPNRTFNCFLSEHAPYKLPELWIKQIKVQNTTLTNGTNPFVVNFNPQLTTIIGGRGSGKSSVLRMLRGVFGKTKELEELNEIISDQTAFFKITDNEGQGVLKEDTHIEVYFVRNDLEYRVVWEYGKVDSPIVERYNVTTGQYDTIGDEAYIDFFEFEEYSQKQIFSIAQKPNSLRSRIDSAIPEMQNTWISYKQARLHYRELKAKQRTLKQTIQIKGKLQTEIKDLQSKIELLKQTGISDLINQQQRFESQKKELRSYLYSSQELINKLNELKTTFLTPIHFNSDAIDEKYRDEILADVAILTSSMVETGKALNIQANALKEAWEKTRDYIKESTLIKDAIVSKGQFEESKKKLEEKGITDMTNFQKYSEEIEAKNKELASIAEKEKELAEVVRSIKDQKQEILKLRKNISQLRSSFVREKVNSSNIQINILPFSDSRDWEYKMRRITQKQTSYERGFETARNVVYKDQDVLQNLDAFKESMHHLHNDSLRDNTYDGWYSKLIQELSPNQLDEIDLLFPEDEIEMKYIGRDGQPHSIAVASAGQKTTAILSFILSFGTKPLILDQPEDDLDNRLVSQLIVEKIRQIKEHRQVIVVTHNANIPVNGDAEFVVSMATETPKLKIQAQGTVEDNKVKEEICEVMEGGVEAFKTRAERYSSLSKK